MISNNPISTLLAEHEVISKIDKKLSEIDLQWQSDAEKYNSSILKILDFLKRYSDGYHHHKEEKVLFPALNEHPDFLLKGILDELIEHHENFREYAQEALDALTEKKYPIVQKKLRFYLNQLADHIAIENDELFIMAENLFDENELEKIYFKFKDIDLELGETLKIELEKIPNEI